MLASKNDSSGTSELDDLFGLPPLMKGEDKARYYRLLAAVERDFKPQNIFDKNYVREFTYKLWEQQRYRQGTASLVEGAYIDAMATLLSAFTPRQTMEIGESSETKMARDYYSGDATSAELEKIETVLAQRGITEEQIRAKAMQLSGAGISMFSRMETNCETSLRMLRKEQTLHPVVENRKDSSSN